MAKTKQNKPRAAAISAKVKNPLQYAIIPEFEQEIREYIDGVNKKTGLPKSRIATNLLLDAIHTAKKFYPCNSENSEMIPETTANA